MKASDKWFSAKVCFVVLSEVEGPLAYRYSVFLIAAEDFDSAFARVLYVAKKHEESYLNEDYQKIAWKLKEIVTLDMIRDEHLDGAEILHESEEIPEHERQKIGTYYQPELSKPRETI